MNVEPQSQAGGGTPLWFGPVDRPLFGWLHLPPDGLARGGVVLCQALGIEATCGYFTYRLLAEALAARGIAVLRFDYDGTGDSAGDETDPDRLEAWLDSLTVATDRLAETGVGAVGLVGLRLGALFAAHEASRRGGVDALVLWDPCVSGRSFLREQRFLRTVSGATPPPAGAPGPSEERDGPDGGDDGSVEAPGIRFEPETVKALSDLDLKKLPGDLAARTLVLLPSEPTRPGALVRRLEGADVDWQEASGQDRLLDSTLQEPPAATLERMVDWLAGALDGDPVPVAAPRSAPTVVARTDGGVDVVERTVRLGDLGLFGIVTEPRADVHGPTLVLVNEGNTPHIGQARIWVELARRLAPAGIRVLRFDLSGNGDSPWRAGQEPHVGRAPEAIDDVWMAMEAISPDRPTDVVLVGFCSGAYEVLEQALAHPPAGICVINPSFAFRPAEVPPAHRPARQLPKAWYGGPLSTVIRRIGERRSSPAIIRMARAVEVGSWPSGVAKRAPGIPSWVWSFVNRTLLDRPAISTLERIVASGVDLTLVSGPTDMQPIELGAGRRIAALEARPDVRIERLDALDHASWVRWQRVRLIDVLERSVTATLARLSAGR